MELVFTGEAREVYVASAMGMVRRRPLRSQETFSFSHFPAWHLKKKF